MVWLQFPDDVRDSIVATPAMFLLGRSIYSIVAENRARCETALSEGKALPRLRLGSRVEPIDLPPRPRPRMDHGPPVRLRLVGSESAIPPVNADAKIVPCLGPACGERNEPVFPIARAAAADRHAGPDDTRQQTLRE